MFVQNQQYKQNKKLFFLKVNALESLIVEFFFFIQPIKCHCCCYRNQSVILSTAYGKNRNRYQPMGLYFY